MFLKIYENYVSELKWYNRRDIDFTTGSDILMEYRLKVLSREEKVGKWELMASLGSVLHRVRGGILVVWHVTWWGEFRSRLCELVFRFAK